MHPVSLIQVAQNHESGYVKQLSSTSADAMVVHQPSAGGVRRVWLIMVGSKYRQVQFAASGVEATVASIPLLF